MWEGRLRLVDGLEIRVSKHQNIDFGPGGPHVETQEYSYQVLRKDTEGVTNLWRYDNAHSYVGHADAHHLHLYRDDGTDEVVHVGEAGWPTLGDVIDDLFSWWSAHLP